MLLGGHMQKVKNFFSLFVSFPLWLLLGVVYASIVTFLASKSPDEVILFSEENPVILFFLIFLLLHIVFYVSLRGMRRARLIGWAGPTSFVVVLVLWFFSGHVTHTISPAHIEMFAVTQTINTAYLPHWISYFMAFVWIVCILTCKCRIFMRRKKE